MGAGSGSPFATALLERMLDSAAAAAAAHVDTHRHLSNNSAVTQSSKRKREDVCQEGPEHKKVRAETRVDLEPTAVGQLSGKN